MLEEYYALDTCEAIDTPKMQRKASSFHPFAANKRSPFKHDTIPQTNVNDTNTKPGMFAIFPVERSMNMNLNTG